jgi:hypothetical protein
VVFALAIVALVVVIWVVVALAALSLCRVSALADADARRLVAAQVSAESGRRTGTSAQAGTRHAA